MPDLIVRDNTYRNILSNDLIAKHILLQDKLDATDEEAEKILILEELEDLWNKMNSSEQTVIRIDCCLRNVRDIYGEKGNNNE